MTTIERAVPPNRVWTWQYESREDNDVKDWGAIYYKRADAVEELIQVLSELLVEDFAYPETLPDIWDVWAFAAMAYSMRLDSDVFEEYHWEGRWLDIWIIPNEIR